MLVWFWLLPSQRRRACVGELPSINAEVARIVRLEKTLVQRDFVFPGRIHEPKLRVVQRLAKVDPQRLIGESESHWAIAAFVHELANAVSPLVGCFGNDQLRRRGKS